MWRRFWIYIIIHKVPTLIALYIVNDVCLKSDLRKVEYGDPKSCGFLTSKTLVDDWLDSTTGVPHSCSTHIRQLRSSWWPKSTITIFGTSHSFSSISYIVKYVNSKKLDYCIFLIFIKNIYDNFLSDFEYRVNSLEKSLNLLYFLSLWAPTFFFLIWEESLILTLKHSFIFSSSLSPLFKFIILNQTIVLNRQNDLNWSK